MNKQCRPPGAEPNSETAEPQNHTTAKQQDLIAILHTYQTLLVWFGFKVWTSSGLIPSTECLFWTLMPEVSYRNSSSSSVSCRRRSRYEPQNIKLSWLRALLQKPTLIRNETLIEMHVTITKDNIAIVTRVS